METTIDFQALENHEFMIKPDFDERLGGMFYQPITEDIA